MGFLDKVDIEEKACNTVQNAFKMHEPTKKMVVDRFWPYHDKVRESSIAKTIELDSCYKYDNAMSAYAYARDYGMEVTLKFDGMSPYMLMVNTEIKNGFFGLSAKTTEDDGLTRISPEFLDTVLENAFKDLSHEELRRARVDANKQSLPEYFTFSKEIVENCELAPVKEAKNTHGAGFTIVPNNGKLIVSSVSRAMGYADAELLMTDSNNNLVVFNTEDDAVTALNKLAPREYIYPHYWDFQVQEPVDGFEVTSMKAVANWFNETLANQEFENSLDDLKEKITEVKQ